MQSTAPGILGGIIKGFKGGKVGHPMDHSESLPRSTVIQKLDDIFSRFPFSDPSSSITVDQEVAELSIGEFLYMFLMCLRRSLPFRDPSHPHICCTHECRMLA